MPEYKQLSPKLFVRPQVDPAEVSELAARGFKGIINARPDDEERGQPKSTDLAAEAERHGLDYWHIPVAPGEPSASDGNRFADALQRCQGPVVGFCKSGARATKLWELANPSSQPS